MESKQKEEGFSEEGPIAKCCSDCKTRKTPLWRSGPCGPKSLCNACGIRYRKKPHDNKAKKKMKSGLMGAKSRRQWSEVERAALLLMALSCGAVFT